MKAPTSRARRCGERALLALALGCAGAEPGDTGQPTSAAPADTSRLALCGGQEQTCCTETSFPCGRGLACDVAANVCRAPNGVLSCQSDADCAPAGRCCAVGLYGTCQALEPDESCPLPDLVVLSAGVGVNVTEELFDGVNTSSEGCFRERGVRQLLRAPVALANFGAVDFILGDRAVSRRGDETARENFLRYTLIDAAGNTAAASSGPLPCRDGYSGALDPSCEFAGLRAGAIEPVPMIACEPLDVTWLPPGSYRLRVELSRQWPDANSNNELIELPVELPSFDPLVPCPAVDNPFQGSSEYRECGWSRASPLASGSCTPGEDLVVTCDDCVNSPVLRLCPGDDACTSLGAVSNGLSYADAPCVSVYGRCPGIGRYNVLVASAITSEEAACTVALAPPL